MAESAQLRPPGAGALVRLGEAGRSLGVGEKMMRKMVAAGTIEAIYLHPKVHPRVRWADVEALARGEQPARSKATP